MLRPKMKELFIDAPKRLEIGFYTSSIEKFFQARLVFQKSGLTLRHFKESQEPYREDYSLSHEQFLARAINEIKHRLGVNSLFFVEDTSVKIDALSSADRAVPGLEMKEWFSRTSFAELDAELHRHGNIRTATVYSDIALHVPGLNQPVFIHEETSGYVAETPPTFKMSEKYPWLTPDTFNGWFIPHGSEKRLGEMSFEESQEYDFRVKSLIALIDRLEEYAAILNLRGQSYTVRRPILVATTSSLFKEAESLFVVIGKLCAGKTTMGEYMLSNYSSLFIEASSIMRMVAEEANISAPTAYHQARELLQAKGPDIIARHIVGIYGQDIKNDTIISGFRTIEEIRYIKSHFPDCKVVLIDASERTRLERHLHRGRINKIKSINDFREHDKQQWLFGLLSVAQDLADIKIENEGSIKEYHAQIDALIKKAYGKVPGVSEITHRRKALKESRVFRCLRALEQVSGPATCQEIAQLTKRNEPSANEEHVERISARHVNWVLTDIPEFARRINAKGAKIRYEILPAGCTYLKAIRAMKE